MNSGETKRYQYEWNYLIFKHSGIRGSFSSIFSVISFEEKTTYRLIRERLNKLYIVTFDFVAFLCFKYSAAYIICLN